MFLVAWSAVYHLKQVKDNTLPISCACGFCLVLTGKEKGNGETETVGFVEVGEMRQAKKFKKPPREGNGAIGTNGVIIHLLDLRNNLESRHPQQGCVFFTSGQTGLN